jgi:hypothetical protein
LQKYKSFYTEARARMGMIDWALDVACSFPIRVKFSQKTMQTAHSGFERAAAKCRDVEKYLSFGLFASLALGAFSSAICFLALSDEILSAGVGLFSFGSIFLVFISLPAILAVRRERLCESELPYLLRELAIYIDIGLPFEKCIGRLAEGSYCLSREFARSEKEISAGSSVQASLAAISSSTRSFPLKRALLLLSTIYGTGKGTEPLRRMADEISAAQISEMRSGAGRFSLLAIAFIAVSALLPSFFAVLAAASPLALGARMEEWQVWLAYLLVFPVLDLIALCAMYLLLPPVKGEGRQGGEIMERYLAGWGLRMQRRGFASSLALVSLFLSAICFAMGSASLALLSICTGPAIYALAAYFSQLEIKRAEIMLPDALYTVAATHKLLSSEKMLSLLAKGGFGRVSDAFALALARQNAGDSFQSSMDAASRHCPSMLAARAFSLLVVAYETGADMYTALRESAQDVASFFAVVRERSSLLSIQRYTVLASCALLVPAILGTVAFLAPALAGSNAGGTPESEPVFIASITLACQAYLVINAALSSLLLALSESDPMRAALYFAFCAPISLLAFSLASSSALALG